MNQHYSLLLSLFAVWESNDDTAVDFDFSGAPNAYASWFGLHLNQAKMACLVDDETALLDLPVSLTTCAGPDLFNAPSVTLA